MKEKTLTNYFNQAQQQAAKKIGIRIDNTIRWKSIYEDFEYSVVCWKFLKNSKQGLEHKKWFKHYLEDIKEVSIKEQRYIEKTNITANTDIKLKCFEWYIKTYKSNEKLYKSSQAKLEQGIECLITETLKEYYKIRAKEFDSEWKRNNFFALSDKEFESIRVWAKEMQLEELWKEEKQRRNKNVIKK